ncbi:RnfABCDGE type electron transport complex subunit D [Oscillatoria sp. FACHB-1406]|uniref:RnfABCDGE type electron transport complex subunit D n=1 Tax=Oscillatoria sp. FACHB-1406 TaxID=2692846 RepID=UPI0018F057D3|nr:RnfABCDGE type electron transport complex subunit D [Oscillatoria sp. FACHB-1406]
MKTLFKDARDYQILFLSTFLILGISTRDWTLRADLMFVVIASCLVTQWLFVSGVPFLSAKTRLLPDLTDSPPKSPPLVSSLRSALITGLGLCLLLRANDWKTMALAGFLAIASKFICSWRGKHFFNPANFGIIAALVLTPDAWVSPGQWGTDWWYLLLFAGAGGIVLHRVGRWDTSATFLATYAGLETARTFWLGQGWDVSIHQLSSGSLLLFALFMLTDPRSIPDARVGRLVWSVAIASVAFILQYQYYLSTAIFWTLFAFSPLTLILDAIWKQERFNWIPNLPNPIPRVN